MKDETGKIIFDQDEQQEVNRIVEERLIRERGKYTDYEDLKGTLDELNALGYQGSPKEVREAIRAVKEETLRQQEIQNSLQEVQQQIKDEGTSPELKSLLAELKKELADNKKEIAELKKEKEQKIQEAKQAKEKEEHAVQQVNDFKSNFENEEEAQELLNKLNADEEFIDFFKGSNPNLSLYQIYQRYTKYVQGAEHKAIAKIQSNLERSTSSGKEKGKVNYHGLTADQRQTVDDWNKSNPRMKMTYEEFAQNLRR